MPSAPQLINSIQWWSLKLTLQCSIMNFIPPTSKMNPFSSLFHQARSFFLHMVRSMFPQGCAVLQKHRIFCPGCWTCRVEQHPGTTWWHSCPSPLSCWNQSLRMSCALSVLGNEGRRTCCRFYKLKEVKSCVKFLGIKFLSNFALCFGCYSESFMGNLWRNSFKSL